MGTGFDAVADAKTVVLTTYRKDGTPVPTAVNLAVREGRAYFRTYDQAYKAKRLARNPRVEVAPSTYMGKPTGEAIAARARLLDDDDPLRKWISKSVSRQHPVLQGILVPFFHRMKGYRTQYYELTVSEAAE